jgi:dihydrofolate synthase/folylpolyglutamate synthase
MYRKFGPGEKANIDQMRNLTAYFGNPQDKFKSIHVAGTNGKGTVSIKTAKVLELAGYKTGLFISPHISTFRERITINS